MVPLAPSPSFQFAHEVAFCPDAGAEAAEAALRQVHAGPGVLSLRGDTGQPYITRAADLRRRVQRLLAPPESAGVSRRLNLRERVRSIAWTPTGSEFAAMLVLYEAMGAAFGWAEARKRLRLHTPYFLRFTANHQHPRLYTTNRLSARSLATTYGPFPSRTAAERYADEILDLFKLRRCYEDLDPHPEHPGCAYGEMKRCLAPCNQLHQAGAYQEEAAEVRRFLDTRGESLLEQIGAARDRASAEMDFEAAAGLHAQYSRVKAAAALADPLTAPIPRLSAVIVQRAAPGNAVPAAPAAESLSPEDTDLQLADVFCLHGGCLRGPEPLSTLGVRAVREQTAVGSSLFAQPLMLQAVPLGDALQATPSPQGPAAGTDVSLPPEARAAGVLARLQQGTPLTTEADGEATLPDVARLSDHLSLLRRWYFRPEKSRAGELLLPGPDGNVSIRKLLNASARVVLGTPREMAATDRAAAPEAKLRILHQGREGVERAVPTLPKRKRGKAAAAVSLLAGNED